MARLLSFEWLRVSPFCRVRTQPTATTRALDARKARQGGPPCAGLPAKGAKRIMCTAMLHLNRRVAVCAGGVLLAGAVLLRAQVATPSAPPQAVDFTRDIEPIFRRYCYECHGPAGETQGAPAGVAR